MAAGRAHRQWPDDHQLVEVFGVGEFSDGRRLDVAAPKHLVEVHLGDAARGVVGVVVASGVNHQAVEYALHLHFDLIEQLFKLAGLDEAGNVVVGVKAFFRLCQALADLHGDGRALIKCGRFKRC